MVAYMIFMRDQTVDPGELALHTKSAAASVVGFPITRRAVYGRFEVLEGAPTEGIVILEFPSFEEAREWYHSPAYREAREHRMRGANYRCFIVEGIA
jgi:uncharacterized protein (DUF1330 family)